MDALVYISLDLFRCSWVPTARFTRVFLANGSSLAKRSPPMVLILTAHASRFSPRRYVYGTTMQASRLVLDLADMHQRTTQSYVRRPYGVGMLVAAHDQTGPHLFQTCPSGNYFEYVAMAIGARSQSAKTYLEKHFEEFEVRRRIESNRCLRLLLLLLLLLLLPAGCLFDFPCDSLAPKVGRECGRGRARLSGGYFSPCTAAGVIEMAGLFFANALLAGGVVFKAAVFGIKPFV